MILAFDPSWTCTGYAVCTDTGPVRVGSFGKRQRRYSGLLAALEGIDSSGVERAVLEEPGRHDGLHGGGDVSTVRGISLCVGAIALWATRFGEPWLVEPHEWRRWWGLGGVAREKGKAQAQALVAGKGWGQHGPDVAEAILIGVGAAQNFRIAPKK